jgi:Uncharacterized protein conserved in bacteria (DUF2169)
MICINNTPLPAILVPNAEAGDDIAALLVASVTYRFVGGAKPSEALVLTREQRPILRGMDGEAPGDDVFVRAGVSVIATGSVHAAGGEARRAEAVLRVGSTSRTVVAFGPRVWQRGAMGLTPSQPRSFDRIPMTWESTYGGRVRRPPSIVQHGGRDVIVPEHEVASPWNPEGTGFYLEERQAENHALPLLEDAAALVSKWDDRPEPLCFAPYPTRGGLRALAALDREGRVDFNLAARLTNRAAPRMVFTDVPVDTLVSISGMRSDGETLAFELPPSPVFLEVDLDGATTRLDPKVDAVEIETDRGDVRLVYRTLFRYPLIQEALRIARLETTARFAALAKRL